MKNTTKISLALIGGLILQSIGGGLAFADVTIDGVTYTDEWIRNNPTEVAKYIDANPAAAAAILQANPAAAAAVANAYNAARGTNYTTDTGMATLNQEATKSGTPANVVVVGNQAYSNDWIKANQAVVVDYISKNPSASANILQNASNDTKQAVLNAYNKATGNNMTLADGTKWINQNAVPGLTREWLAKHGGISKDPVWNDYTGLANDAQVAMWLKENPGLTPGQIVDAMQKYGIGLNQMVRAMKANNPTAPIIGAQELMKMANNAGITNEQLSQKGIIGPMGWAETRNNIWWAVQAGVMNKGVMCAAFFVDQGTVNPDCPVYTKEDLNLALSYQKTGYWGPTGSGDPYIELTKAGMIKNGAYTGPNNWGNGTAKVSSGANIAGTNYSTNYTPVTKAGVLPTYTPTSGALSCSGQDVTTNFACRGDLTVGTRIGDTITYTNAQIKEFFASKPSTSDIVAMAVSKKMTTYDVAKALAIAGVVNTYDVKAVTDYVIALPGYALGPDNIIVKLQPGQTKRASDGLLEGTWSSDPGHVSYTDWARAWYCAGNGDVNGGKVDYGRGPTTQQCSTDSNVAGGMTTAGGNSTASNPYAASFSAANINTLNNWIATKVIAKKGTMTPDAYSNFITTLSTKISSVKSTITNQSKLNILNYLQYEINK